MSGQVNPERVNDIAKLMMHRLIARAIGHDPSLIDKARDALVRGTENHGYSFVDDWSDILKEPAVVIRRRLTSRDENMTRLRVSSPFALVEGIYLADPDLRRRIWRSAHQMAGASVERASHNRMAA